MIEIPTTSPGCTNDAGDRIRCRNWESNPALCGADCFVDYSSATAAKGIPWTRWIHALGWFTIENGRVHDGHFHHHAVPFCSLGCLYDWIQREHGDVVDQVHGLLLRET